MPGIGIGVSPLLKRGGGTDWNSYWATLISATVENAAPTHVVLTFPSAQPSLGASDFAIAGFTVDSASWAGAILTLVLSEAVMIYDGNLTITFGKTGETANVTNNVADDGNTVAWFDYSDASTITKDGSNNTQIWWDKLIKNSSLGAEESSGSTVANGIYLITATQSGYFYAGCKVGDIFHQMNTKTLDANNKVRRYAGPHLGMQTLADRPLWSTDGIITDGVSDRMAMATMTYNQPCSMYLLFKPISWTQYDQIVGFESGPTSYGLNQAQTTPRMRVHIGSSSTDSANSDATIGEFAIVRIILNGASSKFQVNEQTAITGNFGTANPGAIGIGDYYAGGARDANICYREMIFRSGVDGEETYAAIYNYLLKKK